MDARQEAESTLAAGATPSTQPPAASSSSPRCQFVSSDGRRCTMDRAGNHSALCLHHSREEQTRLETQDKDEQLAAELATLSGDFKTANDINRLLGRIFSLFAQRRISRRDAVAFAYIGQLLLQTLPSVKHEVQTAQGLSAWQALVRTSLAGGDPPGQT